MSSFDVQSNPSKNRYLTRQCDFPCEDHGQSILLFRCGNGLASGPGEWIQVDDWTGHQRGFTFHITVLAVRVWRTLLAASIKGKFFNLPCLSTMAKPQLTFLHYVCIELLPIFAYTVPSRYRKLAFAAIAIPTLYVIFFMKIAGTAPFTHILDIGIGMRLAAILLYGVNDLIIHDAQAEYRRIGDKTDVSTRPFLSRLWWSFQVYVNPRGVGWTQELSGLPPKPKESSRYRFLRFLALDLIRLLIIWDINGLIMRINPYYTREQRVEGFERLWRLTYSPGYAINLMVQISMEQSVVAILCLAMGYTRPDEWRPIFGSLKETYSLAKFWG